MGFNVSWMAFHSAAKDQILARAGLRDTGEADPSYGAPFCGANVPGDWFLYANDSTFVSPERLASLSADCLVVACQVHEGVMVSAAYSYERGVKLWEIEHDPQKGPRDLSFFGSLPPVFQSIRQRQTELQDEERDDAWLPVDHIFDIPVQTAARLCGFRHDRGRFDWGDSKFTRLEPLSPPSSKRHPLEPRDATNAEAVLKVLLGR